MTVSNLGAAHGLLVTFRRPDALERMLKNVTRPSQGLASLTVVDNAPSEAARAMVAEAGQALPTRYLAMTDNGGPAGAVAVGAEAILQSAASWDWIQVLDDDDPPADDSALTRIHVFAETLRDSGHRVGAVGIVGARFRPSTGRLHRPDDEELHGPVPVDYVAGNQLLLASVEGIRAVGAFDPDLFFGYEELDFCLRLKRAGFEVVADGDQWMVARKRAGRTGPKVGRSERKSDPWRRYYAVRNHIVVVRRHGMRGAPLAVSIGHLVVRPFNDLRRGEGVLTLGRLTARGVFDAWSGRLGRRIEPSPGVGIRP